jgi:hypothetical protein
LTFIGITHGGIAFCRCDCGRFDTFDPRYLFKSKKTIAACVECRLLAKRVADAQRKPSASN